MAITQVLARSTVYSAAFLCTQDGAAGTTLLITNAQLVAALAGIPGPLRDLLTTDTNPNSQALQRQALLGNAAALASQDLRNVPHAQVIVTAISVIGGWAVDADVDGTSALRGELNVVGPAAAGDCLVAVEFQHTFVR